MRHLQSIKKARDTLVAARRNLVELMIKDPGSNIHWLDHTPDILREIDEAIAECDTYDLNRR
jgi:hypothetical protein